MPLSLPERASDEFLKQHSGHQRPETDLPAAGMAGGLIMRAWTSA